MPRASAPSAAVYCFKEVSERHVRLEEQQRRHSCELVLTRPVHCCLLSTVYFLFEI